MEPNGKAQPPVGRVVGPGRPRGGQIIEILRDAIVTGRFAPGERLIETSLSAELGTSRGPVREALQHLANEGLVTSFPYRGAVVLDVSNEEVNEVLIPIRLALERYSFLRALDSLTESEYAELAKQIWLIEQAAKADDLLKLVDADLRFHEIVMESADQQHALQIWRSIWPRIRAYFYRYGHGRVLEVMADEHRELLAALQTRDPVSVMSQLERHIVVGPPANSPSAKPVSTPPN